MNRTRHILSSRMLPRVARLALCVLAVMVMGISSVARAQFGPPVVSATATPQYAAAPPGTQMAIAVTLEYAAGWHSYPNIPVLPKGLEGTDATPTTLGAITLGDGSPLPSWLHAYPDHAQWPTPVEVETGAVTGTPIKLLSYTGTAVVYVPVTIDADAPAGPVTLRLSVAFQACDDHVCLPPDVARAEVSFTVVPPGTAPASSPAGLFTDFKPSVFAELSKPVVGPAVKKPGVPFNIFGYTFSVDPATTAGFIGLVLLAFVGGAILNLTPCVLPVIPLKMMSLTRSAGDHRRSLVLGASMSLGIIAFWLVLGGIISGSTAFKAPSQLISIWWLDTAIGLLILVLSLSMFGAFTIQLPQWVYLINPKHDTARGSFNFGILTAVLSTPCVAPFMGAAVGWAAFQPMAKTLGTFGAVGVGMALPYFVLAARPQLIARVPRSGASGELVKQILGLLMIAVAAFFIGTGLIALSAERPWAGRILHWWVIAMVGLIAGAWLVARTFRLTGRIGVRGVFLAVALVIAAAPAGWAWYQSRLAYESTIWKEYEAAKVDEALKAGEVVVLDFTAEWCGNCKVIEAAVLARSNVRAALTSPGVRPFRVDLTSSEAPGWKALRDLGQAGIPVLAIKGPASSDWVVSNAYTRAWVIEQINAARGKGASSARE